MWFFSRLHGFRLLLHLFRYRFAPAMVLGYLAAVELEDLRTRGPAQALDVIELGYFKGSACLNHQQVAVDGIKGDCEAGALVERLTLVWIQDVLSLLVNNAVHRCKAVFQR